MKRLISLLLTLAMLFGVAAIAPFTAQAQEGAEEYNFCLIDNIGVSNATAIAFNNYIEDGEIDYSDSYTVKMEDNGESLDSGYPVLKATFGTTYKYITLTGTSDYGPFETKHLSFEKYNGKYCYASSKYWYDTAEEAGDEYRVYFVDSSDWGTITAQAYKIDSETEETKYSETVPSYCYDDEDYEFPVYYFRFKECYDSITFYGSKDDEKNEIKVVFSNDYFYDCASNNWYGSLSEIGNDGGGDDNWDDGGEDDSYEEEDDGLNTFYVEMIEGNVDQVYAYASTEEIDEETGLEVVISSNATEEYPLGQPMEKMEGIKSADGNDIYKIVVDGDYRFISFNNNVDKGEANSEWSKKLNFNEYDDRVYKYNRYDYYNSLEEAIYGPVNDYNYEYLDSDDDGQYDSVKITNCYIEYGVVKIPSHLNGYPVTTLKQNMFSDSYIIEIIIPETVQVIEGSLFWNCPNVESIVVEEGNPYFTSGYQNGEEFVECNAIFDKDVKRVIVGCTNTVIPDTVTTIGTYAFSGSRIESVTLGEAIKTVGEFAFYACDSIKNIEISKNVTSIADDAFIGCYSIENISVDKENPNYSSTAIVNEAETDCNVLMNKNGKILMVGSHKAIIPTSVTQIADGAFTRRTHTEKLVLHEGITHIGSNAFYECRFTSLYIPASVTDIGDQAFNYCDSLESIVVADGNKNYRSKDANGEQCNAIITTALDYKYNPDNYDPDFEGSYEEPDGDLVSGTWVTLIQGCNNTVVPDDVEVIGSSAFEGMTEMIEIIIPESVIRVEGTAFFNCLSMKRITVMNKDCLICFSSDTLAEKAVIRGYNGSYAHRFAFKYNKRFLSYEETADWGTIKESTIYFVNTEGWDRVYAYAYNENGDKYSNEPVIMDLVVDAWSVYDVYGFTFDHKYDKVIFTDSKSKETYKDTTTFESSKYYESYENKWYDSLGDIKTVIPGYYMMMTNKDEISYSKPSYGNRFKEDPKVEGEYILKPQIYANRFDEEGNEITEYPVYLKVVKWDGARVTEWYKNEAIPGSSSPEGDEPAFTFDRLAYECPVLHFNPDGNTNWDYTYINVEEHYYNDNGECEYCGATQPDKDVVLKGNSITLSGKIEVNFFMAISDEIAEGENNKVVFTYPDGTKEDPNGTGEFTIDFSEQDINDFYDLEYDCYMFTCPVAAKEMTGDITLKFYQGDELLGEGTCSVKGYLEKLLKDPAKYNYEIPLAKALLNYGAASQNYFGYKTNDLANNSDYMNEIDKQLRQGINLEDYYPSIENYIDGVTYYGSSLLLDSTTSIIHYFLIDEEIVNVDELTFQADSPEFSYEVICQKNEDLYEVEIRDIYAQNLEDELILSVNGGELTLNYNAFSFGYLVMNANENEALMNVVRALYDYNQAANNYL